MATLPNRVRIGFVGASPARGWFLAAHLPALKALKDQFEISAVCTSQAQTAALAKDLTGSRWAFDDYNQLVQCEDVDLVVVTVKTRLHDEIVRAAIKAGKNVLCEWPLGRDVPEAEALADLADQAGVRHVIGLQARAAPAVVAARRLIREGYVGRVLSTSIVASGFGWGPFIDPDQVYLFDAKSGSSMLNITGGHLLDALCHVCGEFESVGAQIATRRQRIAVVEPAATEPLRRFDALLEPEGARPGALGVGLVRALSWFAPTSPDQVAVNGLLENGAVASAHVRGGQHRGTNLLWEINGEEGELQITGSAGTLQTVELTLRGGRGRTANLEPLPFAEEHQASACDAPRGPAANVWRLYQAYLGLSTPPDVELADFRAAAGRQRLLTAIEQSAAEGRTVSGFGAPRLLQASR